MNVVVEILLLLVRVTWLWMVAVYKAVVPARFQKQKNISEQTVLITGAGSGLGRLMSVRFGMLGCRVILWDVDEKGNKQTEELVKAVGAKVSSYTVDLSSRDNIYNAADKVKSDIGDVDILVNNAGIVTGKKILDAPDSLMQKTMDVNATAHFWTTKRFLPPMLEKNKGHIVSIASSAGLFGVTGLVDYCASKFAAVGFDESLRTEIAQQGKTGVNTTVVCPYFINTGMFDGVKTKFPGMLPILKPEYVVDKIIEAVLTNQEMLILPRSVYVAYMLRGVLPCTVGELVNQFLGIASSMDDFVGRAKSD